MSPLLGCNPLGDGLFFLTGHLSFPSSRPLIPFSGTLQLSFPVAEETPYLVGLFLGVF